MWPALLLVAGVMSGCDDEDPTVPPLPPHPWETVLGSRADWMWASLPAELSTTDESQRRFRPADRAFTHWHRSVPGVLRGDLDPRLSGNTARTILPALQLRLESNDPAQWQPTEFAGVMRGFPLELDVAAADYVEFWINDFTGDPEDPTNPREREGILHFDFGSINEDFWWPAGLTDLDGYSPEFDTEDTDGNLVLGPRQDDPSRSEDTGLDGLADDEQETPRFPQRPGRASDPAGDNFDALMDDELFLYINGTEANQRLDSEDVNGNGRLDERDGYFTLSLDLADPGAIVDTYRDYDDPRYEESLAAAREKGWAWRQYRLELADREIRRALDQDPYYPTAPDLARLRFLRIWYENPDGDVLDAKTTFVLTQLRFGTVED